MRDKNYKALQGKLERLEKLCRAMQLERNDLNQKLRALQGPAKDPEEEGTGPPDPQLEELSNPELEREVEGEVEREVEGEMGALVPETEKVGLQPDDSSSTSSRQLIDD